MKYVLLFSVLVSASGCASIQEYLHRPAYDMPDDRPRLDKQMREALASDIGNKVMKARNDEDITVLVIVP